MDNSPPGQGYSQELCSREIETWSLGQQHVGARNYSLYMAGVKDDSEDSVARMLRRRRAPHLLHGDLLHHHVIQPVVLHIQRSCDQQ